ncbi:hypothetical protein GKE82_10965 [Conexibacter sp. W3-3-2]|uniref:hypothetical protein n=1 Tax=Conexibacter sp. W3-3-2 TaxID=2675227 RepID=UPI0012B88306|nr:hypothetical protein [Conexibacter sp. W3-3-2]MTD44796.1 hypothetical protein [Conexibacter sp. W3-3-2]
MPVSKDPDDYRYAPPAERTAAIGAAGAYLLAVILAAPAIVALVTQGLSGDLALPSLASIVGAVAVLVARRALAELLARLARAELLARVIAPRLPEPSKDPDHYR